MKSALFVWGGWEGHEPKQCIDIFAPLLRAEGYEITISDTLDSYLDRERMHACSLIVQVYTMATITREQEKGFWMRSQAGSGSPDGTAVWLTHSARAPTISSWSAVSGSRTPAISSTIR